MKGSAAYAALLALFVATLPAPDAFAASETPIGSDPGDVVSTHGVYLVLMDGDPVVTYEGSVPGLEATRPAAGSRTDSRTPAVAAYRTYLEETHEAVLGEAGLATDALLYDYTFALDGFAAVLTPAEAAALARAPGVVSVSRDEVRHLQADSSPDLLGLTDPRGPWATGYTGEDVVIGVIDTGIWPEHVGFAGEDYGPAPAHFSGTACDLGDAVGASCSNKVLTAAAFGVGIAAGTGLEFDQGEDGSARDTNGHGTHVAATAAGNRDVPAAIDGGPRGTASGVAPRARIAAYKACWSIAGRAGQCAVSDVVAAIDQAASDGVDVLNLSIGSDSVGVGVDDVALLFAQASGVVVAAAAGNSGPVRGTVSSVAAVPWVTAVAAATQQRESGGLVTLGDGTVVEGLTVDEGTASLPLIDAADLANARCDPGLGFTDPIEGAIVVCHDLGASHSASAAVAAAGGAGVILAAQPGEQPFDALDEPIPTIAVDADAARVIEAYATAEAPTASIGAVTSAIGSSSVVAPFSSRGPGTLTADLLKPDVVAPGVSILAATAPETVDQSSDDPFAVMSGTSTASAHVAGVFALVRQAHPGWTPDMVRSAVSTTTRRDVWTARGTEPAAGLDMGSGFIQPGGAVNRRGSTFNPGLVFQADLAGYLGFLCGLETNQVMRGTACDEPSLSASALNVPSITVGSIATGVTVTRTVTSVADKLRVFEAQIDAPAGFSVDVSPRSLSLAPGESASFTVEITRNRAPGGEWRTGNVTWVSDTYRVAMPVVVRGVDFDVARSVEVAGPSGQTDLAVVYGFAGAFSVGATGLAPATTVEGEVAQDPTYDVARAIDANSGVATQSVTVSEGAALLRLRLDASEPADDLDLYLYGPEGELAGRATGLGGSENLDVLLPRTGTYVAVVHGWHVADGTAPFTLTTWVADEEGQAVLETAADTAEAERGANGALSLRWSDLEPDTAYVAVVTLRAETGDAVRSIVVVETAGPSAPEPQAATNGLQAASP